MQSLRNGLELTLTGGSWREYSSSTVSSEASSDASTGASSAGASSTGASGSEKNQYLARK